MVFSFSCVAEEAVPDIKIDRNSVVINRVSSEVIERLQDFDKKQSGNIIFTEKVTQAGFNNVIKNNTWIKHVSTKSWNKNINNIEVLSQLTSLETLELSALEESIKKPIDLAPLAKLNNLTELNVYATHVINTDALSQLVKLEKINFHMSSVASVDFLKYTPNVKKLIISGSEHKFKDYAPLANLKQLEVLDLNLNPQATDENLAVLKNLRSLKEITIYRSDITHLNFLGNSTDLRRVDITLCKKLTDIRVLKDMNLLAELNLRDTSIEQLDVLKGKDQLEFLDVSGTKVRNIAALGELPNLERLHILETEIDDISPLMKLTKLSIVHLNDRISPSQVEGLRKKFPGI